MAPNRTSNPLEKHLSALTCYHYYVFVLIFIAKWPLVWHALSLIFLSPPMDFYCEGIDNKENFNKCPCDKPWFDRSVFEATMQTKFLLYCDRSWLIAFSHCICNTGVLVGSLTFGYLSDKYGRLTTFSASCLTIAVSGSLVTVMPTITAFTCMRFFEGMGIGGSIVTSFVLCVEYSATVHREYVTALFHLPLNLGHISMVGVSYLLRDFDNFQLAISLPIFLLVPLRWLMMESPKWLLDNAKLTTLSTGLEKFNRQRSSTSIKEEFEQYMQMGSLNTTAKTVTCFEIFKHKKVVVNFACMAVIYFVCGMGYYGVSQFIGEMSGDIHLNVFISGVSLVPGTITCMFLLKLLGRRPLLMMALLCSGVFMICVVLIPETYVWYRVVFACICNAFFFMAFIVSFLYGVEMFPTSVRNSVLGSLSMVSRIGQIAAPPINSLSEFTAAIFFGIMAVAGGALCFLLPETKGIELPSTLEETRRISKQKGDSDGPLRMTSPKAKSGD